MANENKKNNSIIIFILIGVIALGIITAIYFATANINNVEGYKPETKKVVTQNAYVLSDNNFSKFDLSFLQFENARKNIIYSPLSIKYAFKMLEEAATGDAGIQIATIIREYNLTKYTSNKNMALANAFFVRDSFKDKVKQDYITAIKNKYNANLELDSFTTADNMNTWVKDNTLNLITDLLQDSDVKDLDFALINALGIDMDWKHKFLEHNYPDDKNIVYDASYYHARMQNEEYGFGWISPMELYGKKFDKNQTISSMRVEASLNNYDAVKTLGEDNIRNTVYADFKEWVLKNKEYEKNTFNNDFSDAGIKKVFDAWFDKNAVGDYEGNGSSFIKDLNSNYGRVDYSTDFSIYVNDDVKVFAKDLKEYDGTTLQYVGIMPIKQKLDEYINKLEYTDVKNLINNLKDLKRENFKDGYLTYIHGYIPKFTFEYELNLIEDLKKIGITDVFEQGKANLTNMVDDDSVYVSTAKHKANIEFTQDGIKAAAATMSGGAGAGDWYDYLFEMPTEEIDITFDKPYMFLIRDKKTGETWFVGTVYEPLKISEENSADIFTAPEDRE